MRKSIFLKLPLIAILCWAMNVSSQVVSTNNGVNGKGQSTKAETPSQVFDNSSYSVDPFKGTLGQQVNLGSVSTKSGLSFNCKLSYQSSYTQGSTFKHLSGLPYGDNWNINVPMVTIKTENRRKYTESEMKDFNDPSVEPQPATPLFDIEGTCSNHTETVTPALEEGRVYWYSPIVNIPEIGSQKLVYKSYDEINGFLFVPHLFDNYFEAYLKVSPPLDPYWEITLSNGTIYTFFPQSIHHRSPVNQRVQEDCFQDVNFQKEILANLFLPKSEYLEWYCHSISHTSKTDEILFFYEKYGEFNKLDNFMGPYAYGINTYFFDDQKSDDGLESTFEKILLKEIKSETEKLELNYDYLDETYVIGTYNPMSGVYDGDFMGLHHPNDLINLDGSQYDNAFGKYKVHYQNNGDIGDDWNRYMHFKSEDFITFSDNNFFDVTNPYIFPALDGDNNTYAARHPLSELSDNYFSGGDGKSGGYLESNDLSINSFFAGDIYRIEAEIQSGLGLFDIGIFTGDSRYRNTPSIVDTDYEYFYSRCYVNGFDQMISGTFSSGIKWYAGSGQTFSSHTFTMPSLSGLHHPEVNIKIGPSNADMRFDLDLGGQESMHGYYNNEYEGANDNPCQTDFKVMNSGASYPSNFGIGSPWFLLNDYYDIGTTFVPLMNNLFDLNNNASSDYHDVWWSSDVLGKDRPLHVDNVAYLNSVEMYRYTEYPYILDNVVKSVANEPAASLPGSGGSNTIVYVPQKELSFVYGIESVDNISAIRVKDTAGNNLWTKLVNNGSADQRHIVQLRKVVQTPEMSNYPNTINSPLLSTTRPTYHFDYELKTYSSPSFNSSFFVLSSFTNPLGLTTDFKYNYPDWEAFDITSIGGNGTHPSGGNIVPAIQPGEQEKSYIAINQFETNLWYQNAEFGGGDGCSSVPDIDEPHNGLSYTMHMTVSEYTQDDGNGTNTTKFSYGNLISKLYFTSLGDNFIYGDGLFYNIHYGFESSTVSLPKNSTGVILVHPKIERTFGSGLYFGKLLTEKHYTREYDLVSELENTYDSIKVFEADWINNPPTEHPDFVASDRMYDAPYFLETRFNQTPDDISSFFIKLTQSKATNYLGSDEIEIVTDYEYFDADHNLNSTSPGISLITGGSSLTELPSFQLYSKTVSSPDYPGVTSKQEYFPLYDYINTSLSSNNLVFQANIKRNRSIVSQTRMTQTRDNETYSNSQFIDYYPSTLLPKATYSQIEEGAGIGLIGISSGLPTTLKTSEVTQYNATHQLPEITIDAKGMKVINQYSLNNGNLNQTKVKSFDGSLEELITQYTYHIDDNRLDEMTNPDGVSSTYQYDELGRLTHTYRNNNQLLEIRSYSNFENDLSTTFDQRSNQNYIEQTVFVETGNSHMAKSLVDCYGREAATIIDDTYRSSNTIYDPYGRLVEILPPTASADYNPVYDDTDAPATTQYSKYPLNDEIIQSDYTLGIASTQVTKVETSIISQATATNKLSIAGLSVSNPFLPGSYYLVKSTDQDGKHVQSINDVFGNTIAEISGNGIAATYYDLDSRGNAIEVWNPKNQITTYDYNYLGQVYERTSVDAGTSNYAYDQIGNPVYMSNGEMNTLSIYDNYGRLISTGKTTTSFGSFANNDGNPWISSNTTYDNYQANNASLIERYFTKSFYTNTDNSVSIPSQFSSDLNSSVTEVGKLVQSQSYSEAGDMIQNEYLAYDADGYLAWQGCQMSTDGIDQGDYPDVLVEQSYDYTFTGQVSSHGIDVNADGTIDQETSNEYDGRGRLIEVKLSSDKLGITDQVICDYSYDDITNLIDVTNVYAVDSPCETDPLETIDYTFDGRYRMTSKTSSLYTEDLYYDDTSVPGLTVPNSYNGNIKGVKNTYDFDDLSDDSWHFSSRTIGYVYDNLNRLTEVKSQAQSSAGLPASAPLFSQSGDATYTYDKVGNLLTAVKKLPDPLNSAAIQQTTTYAYQSGTNELASIDVIKDATPHEALPPNLGFMADGNHSYTYNTVGSILTDTKNAINPIQYDRVTYPYQLTNTENNDQIKYYYDSRNMRCAKEITNLDDNSVINHEYVINDIGGRPIVVLDQTNASERYNLYGYDKIGSVTQSTYCDKGGRLVLTGNEPTDYVYKAKSINSIRDVDIANDISYLAKDHIKLGKNFKVQPGKVFLAKTQSIDCNVPVIPYTINYSLTDHLGNVRVEFQSNCESNQHVIITKNVNDYLSFGDIYWKYDLGGESKYQYNDKELDAESRYAYYGARYYDSGIGRFLSVDPLADQFASHSPYSYTFNNPLKYTDPTGMAPETIFEDEDGNVLHETNDGNNHTVTISNSNVEAFQQSVNEYCATVCEPNIDSERGLAQSLFNDYAKSGETLSEVYQVGLTGNATAGIGINLAVGVAWDTQGNVDGYFSFGGSFGGDLSGGVEATRNMSGGFISVNDLKGESTMSTLGIWFADFGKGGDIGGGYPKTLSSPTNTLYSSKSSGLSLGLPLGWTKTQETTVLFNN